MNDYIRDIAARRHHALPRSENNRMTPDAPLPSELRRWISSHLPGNATVTDVSWARDDSRVWHVAAGIDEAFVKLSPTPEDYAREVHGYAYAQHALAAHEAPRLLAADPGLQAIMTSPLPGRVVRGLALEEQEERQVHELAGRLLYRWHSHSEPAPDQDRKHILASLADQAEEAAACLKSTAAYLDTAQRALIERVRDELPQLAEELPLVYRHGDYSTRNWLWHPEHGHGVIDFAMAANGVAVEEFVWLCGAVWAPRPDLKDAYLAGYGRALSDAEQQALLLLTARLGVSYLNTGLAKREPMLVERGRLILDRMRDYQ
ncbi:aminoglycoside phosphotransferase family protein [Streptomyces sp. NPDC088736]|uniref:aminoglycoside phosphotransferase family protein n=1 Tax=Streptomyces sp. NPDC088736 TaxID=3365881 RepID=UPI00380EBC5D